MSSSPDARERVLGKVRGAKGGALDVAASYAGLKRNYVRAGRLGAEERLELMIERLREYDADVVETTPEELPAAIATQLAASGRHVFVAPDGLPAEWLAPGSTGRSMAALRRRRSRRLKAW